LDYNLFYNTKENLRIIFSVLCLGGKGRYPNSQASSRKFLDDVLSHCPYLPTHYGGMHDIVMMYPIANAWMHCVDVAMGIDTLIIILSSN
jgi:hypothetical protein